MGRFSGVEMGQVCVIPWSLEVQSEADSYNRTKGKGGRGEKKPGGEKVDEDLWDTTKKLKESPEKRSNEDLNITFTGLSFYGGEEVHLN